MKRKSECVTFLLPSPRGFPFHFRVKTKVIMVAYKQGPTQPGPSLHQLASTLDSILLASRLQSSHSGCSGPCHLLFPLKRMPPSPDAYMVHSFTSFWCLVKCHLLQYNASPKHWILKFYSPPVYPCSCLIILHSIHHHLIHTTYFTCLKTLFTST